MEAHEVARIAGLLVTIVALAPSCRTGGEGTGADEDSHRWSEVDQLRREAGVRLTEGEHARAVELLESALELWPTSHATERREASLTLVHACALAGDPERGLLHASRALVEQHENAWLWYARGVALFDLGRYEESRASFTESIALDPGRAKAYQWRAEIACLERRHEEAVADLTAALERIPIEPTPDIPEGTAQMRAAVLFARAGSLDALGRADEAEADRLAARTCAR